MSLDVGKFVLMDDDVSTREAFRVGNVVKMKVAKNDRTHGIRSYPVFPKAMQKETSVSASTGVDEHRALVRINEYSRAPTQEAAPRAAREAIEQEFIPHAHRSNGGMHCNEKP